MARKRIILPRSSPHFVKDEEGRNVLREPGLFGSLWSTDHDTGEGKIDENTGNWILSDGGDAILVEPTPTQPIPNKAPLKERRVFWDDEINKPVRYRRMNRTQAAKEVAAQVGEKSDYVYREAMRARSDGRTKGKKP